MSNPAPGLLGQIQNSNMELAPGMVLARWQKKLASYQVCQYDPFVGHDENSKYAGKDVLVGSPVARFGDKFWDGAVFTVEDWYDRIPLHRAGVSQAEGPVQRSWNDDGDKPAVGIYLGRQVLMDALLPEGTFWPEDDEVVYGHWKMPGFPQHRLGDILHVTEIMRVADMKDKNFVKRDLGKKLRQIEKKRRASS